MSRRRQRDAGIGPRHRGRILVLEILVLSLFVTVALRAVQLQVVRADDLRERAESQRASRLELLPARGGIYDRNGKELAQSVAGASVFVDPRLLLANPSDLDALCRTLGLQSGSQRERLRESGSRFAWMKRRVSPAENDAVAGLGLAGVGIAREPHRYYPKKGLAGQVLGFVGIDGTGLGGLEYRYDGALQGAPQTVQAQRDARGRLLLADAPDAASGTGQSLVLTIDETVQHIVEEELSRAVAESRAKGGITVVMDPTSGEILAMAQLPAFNPNSIAASAPEDRKIKAVVDVFEPGSTMKTLFLGILLDRGLARSSDIVFCENGSWTVHGRTIHDHEPHGWLSVADVLKVSSNIGVAKLSERISIEELYAGLRAFGMGDETGVGLGGESAGILPPPRAWSKISAKTIAYGQGISATALQVTAAVGAIANGGMRMQPRLVKAIRDETGKVAEEFNPQPAARAISTETAALLTRLMERVVRETDGTGSLAAVPGYSVAGKTGTAWKPDPKGGGYLRHKVVASFVGFVPSRDPRLVALVAVDEPTHGSRYGGMIAAPAFQAMMGRILAYLQVPPDSDPVVADTAAGVKPRTPDRRRATPSGTMPDLRGLTMRQTLRTLEDVGADVRPSLLGSGLAASQDPPPGSSLDSGQPCRVVFRPLF